MRGQYLGYRRSSVDDSCTTNLIGCEIQNMLHSEYMIPKEDNKSIDMSPFDEFMSDLFCNFFILFKTDMRYLSFTV